MIHNTISLPFGGKENATLTLYCPYVLKSAVVKKFPTILVIPGGGYNNCSSREAEPVALHFLSMGFAAAVLRYSVKEDSRFPQSLCEAALAMAYLREHCEELSIDPCRIFTCGFSAGGHLALSLGVFWDKPWLAEAVKKENALLRPAGQILCYPVVSSDPKVYHGGSIKNLMGGEETKEKMELVSLDKQVSPLTPPTFLWTTQTDTLVPCENSLLLATALQKNGVPLEFHMYGWGRHGLSLASRITQTVENKTEPLQKSHNNPHIATWLPLCYQWLEVMFGVEEEQA